MGDIGPQLQRFEVLSERAHTVPDPGPMPVPDPEPMPSPDPVPGPEPLPQPPSVNAR